MSSYYDGVIAALGAASAWSQGDASGTTAADQIGANNGTYHGGPTLAQPSILRLDPETAVFYPGGTGQSLSLPGPSLASLTGSIALWFKWTAGTALFRDNTGTGVSWIVGFANGANFAMRIGNSSTVNTGVALSAVQDGNVHLLVLTCSGSAGTVNVYIDNVLVTTFTAGTTAPVMPWNLAQNGNITTQCSTMTSQKLAIWTSVLTAAQVGQIWQAGKNAGQGLMALMQ